MKALLISLLMSIGMLCPQCDTTHPLMQVGEVVSFDRGATVLNVNGENQDWYLEDWYLEKGARVLILDCEIVEVLE